MNSVAGSEFRGRAALHYEGTSLEALERFVPFFRDCKRVLDFGCGSGPFLQLCAQAGIEAVGYDPNPRAVEACRSLGFECTGELPDLRQCDGMLMVCVAEHMQPAELHAVLRSFCGVLAIQADEPRDIWIPWLLKKRSFWDDFEHVRPYTPLALRRMLQSFGYEIVEAGRASKPVRFRHFRTWLTDRYLSLISRVTGVTSPHYVVARKARPTPP